MLAIHKKTQIIYKNNSLNFLIAFSIWIYIWLQYAQKVLKNLRLHLWPFRLHDEEQDLLVLIHEELLMNSIDYDLYCLNLQATTKLDNQCYQVVANEPKILTQIHSKKLIQNYLIETVHIILTLNLCLKQLKNFFTNFSMQILLQKTLFIKTINQLCILLCGKLKLLPKNLNQINYLQKIVLVLSGFILLKKMLENNTHELLNNLLVFFLIVFLNQLSYDPKQCSILLGKSNFKQWPKNQVHFLLQSLIQVWLIVLNIMAQKPS